MLYFHKDERFFPSDAKRYMEHCALWDVKGTPFDSKARWGGTSPRTFPHFPRIARGKIIVNAGEPPVDPPDATGNNPGKYLGEPGMIDLNLLDSSDEERFLDPIGWTDSFDVTATSENRHADLDALADIYNQVNEQLIGSRFWYHAEVFNASRLRLAAGRSGGTTLARFLMLKDPALLCYYLFFPGHDEPLQGCTDEFGKSWASHAGGWACVAILLEGDGTESNYQPKQIGLTSRNVGALSALGIEPRVGMILSDWNLVTRLPRDRSPNPVPGDHPRIFVCLDHHSLSIDQVSRPAAEFSTTDFSGFWCGKYETAAQYTALTDSIDQEADDIPHIILVKMIAGAGLLTLVEGIEGPIGGAILGFEAAAIELVAKLPSLIELPPEPDGQTDDPPGPVEIGTVIHSVGLAPTDAPAGQRQVWPRFQSGPDDPTDPALLDETKLDTTVDARAYSLWVATASDPASRPIWLPSETPTTPSFRGRWGNRVVEDPFSRRAGMRFPDFAAMVLDVLGR